MSEVTATHDDIPSTWGRWAGLLFFAVVWLCPTPEGLPSAAHRLAAIAVLMAVWWVTSAWPIAVTSLLPVAVFPLLGIQPAKTVGGAYFSDSSCLYLGGFIIALGIERWGLHRRMALVTISLLGSSPKRIVLGFLLATFFLSMWMSNTATTLVMLPIAMSLLATIGETSSDRQGGASDPQLERLSMAVLLGIAYAASIGGLTTLVGTPTNIVFGDLYLKSFPEAPRISAGEWMLVWVPFGLVFLTFCWLLLSWGIQPSARIGQQESSFFREKLRQLGPMQTGERVMLIVFLMTALLWMFRIDFRITETLQIHGWGDWVIEGLKAWNVKAEPHEFTDWVSDSTVAMTMALLMFFIYVPTSLLPSPLPRGRGAGEKGVSASQPLNPLAVTLSPARGVETRDESATRLRTWKPLMDWQTAAKLPWDILLLFGGGFALADAFRTTGLAQWAGDFFAMHSANQPAWVLVLAVCLILVFMTEFTTNVATVNAVLPILATASVGLGIDPRLLMIPATISASCGFMLPIGTPPNAIVFGTGKVSAGQMAKYGLVMNLAGVVLTVLATLFLLAPQQGIDFSEMPTWAKSKPALFKPAPAN